MGITNYALLNVTVIKKDGEYNNWTEIVTLKNGNVRGSSGQITHL